jgi:O-antigen ligase
VASLPFEYALALRGPVTIAPSYVALLVLFVVCMIHPARMTTKGSLASELNPFVLGYLGVAVLSLVITIVSPPPQINVSSSLLRWRAGDYRGVIQVAFLLFSASTFFVTLFFCSDARRLRFAVSGFIVLSALIALYGIYQMVGVRLRLPLVGVYASGLYEQPASLRPNATFQEPMIFGHFLVAGISLLASLIVQRAGLDHEDRRIYGIAAIPMLMVMVVALVLTVGRGAWLGAAASAAVSVLIMDRSARRRAVLMLSVVTVTGVIGFIVLMGSPTTAWYTVVNRFSLAASSVGAEQRLWYQELLFRLWREHLILGVGFGNYPLYQLARFDLTGIAGAYGIYWQSLVETGTVGFISLVAMLLAAFRLMLRQLATAPHSPWRPYLVGWVGSLTGLLVGYLFMGDRFNLYMWATLGFAMATVKVAAEES